VMPDALIVHLKRFVKGGKSKRQGSVAFDVLMNVPATLMAPIQGPPVNDLARVIQDSEQVDEKKQVDEAKQLSMHINREPKQYLLRAVTTHEGDIKAGHYISLQPAAAEASRSASASDASASAQLVWHKYDDAAVTTLDALTGTKAAQSGYMFLSSVATSPAEAATFVEMSKTTVAGGAKGASSAAGAKQGGTKSQKGTKGQGECQTSGEGAADSTRTLFTLGPYAHAMSLRSL
jgi:hypothetical protein